MSSVAAVYLRVSTEEQTVENQRAPLVALCAARGWTPRFFEETGSAAKRRPVFESMMAAAHRGEVCAVVVAALDRLGRSMVGCVETVMALDRAGVQVVSLRDEWLQMKGPFRSLLCSIFGWVAEYERSVLIERTRAGQARARRQGKHMGRPRSESEGLRDAIAACQRGAAPGDAARRHKVPLRTLKRRLAAIALLDRFSAEDAAAAKVPPEVPPAGDGPTEG